MNQAREPIFQALFDLITKPNANLFRGYQRKFIMWNDTSINAYPFLCTLEGEEMYSGGARGIPAMTTLEVTYWIYTNSQDSLNPAALMNPCLDAIDQVLSATLDVDQRQTLGGLVHHVYIDGKVLKSNGDLGQQGLAMIPLKILVP